MARDDDDAQKRRRWGVGVGLIGMCGMWRRSDVSGKGACNNL